MRLARVVAAVAAAVVAIAATVLVVTQVTEISTAATTAPSTTDTTDGTVATVVPGQGDPLRVSVPAIGVDAPLTPVALLPDGAMETPEFGHAGWYSPGPKPGEAGPSVVVAHVDSKANGPDVFFRLRELAPGDHVTVHYENTATTFVVTGREQAAKTALPTGRIWNGATAPVLRLITCGGAFDRAAGSYLDNVIVYADRLA